MPYFIKLSAKLMTSCTVRFDHAAVCNAYVCLSYQLYKWYVSIHACCLLHWSRIL